MKGKFFLTDSKRILQISQMTMNENILQSTIEYKSIIFIDGFFPIGLNILQSRKWVHRHHQITICRPWTNRGIKHFFSVIPINNNRSHLIFVFSGAPRFVFPLFGVQNKRFDVDWFSALAQCPA